MYKIGVFLIICSIVFMGMFSGCVKEEGPHIIFRSARDAPLDDPDFQNNPQKYFELYSMNIDGSDVQRITDNVFWESQPDISPDGMKIVCSIHYAPQGNLTETDPDWEIAIMNIDGSNLIRLTENEYLDFGAHWNHDGSKIVYISDSARRNHTDIENNVLPQYDIYTMDADGRNKTQLTFANPGDVNADPSFSYNLPSRILYIHSEGLSSNFDLYMMDENGGDKMLLYEHNDALKKINDPMFSPDGSKIIFEALVRESEQGHPMYNIFTLDSTNLMLTRITQDDSEADVLPQFSPDGSKICYYTYNWTDKSNHTHRIRVAQADGSDEKIISSFPWEADPSWFPLQETVKTLE